MKKIFIINALLAAVIAVVACSKEDNKVQETPEIAVSQTGPVTISVNIPEDGLTKVALAQDPSDADGVVKLTWSDSDVITVKNAADESKSVVFGYVSGEGTASAVFSAADVSALAGATSYNIYLTSGMPADYSNQDGSMGYSATLLGVNKYNDVTFSQSWAALAENGSGSCVSSSVLRIRAKMPSAEIASAVQAVIIKSDKSIFATKDSIRIECAPVVDGDVISVYATLPAGPVSEATATKLIFQFQKSADKNDRLTAYREVGSLSFNDGSVNSIKISCTNIDKYAGTSDNGSVSNPYLVGDRNQLQYMNTLMSDSEKHFKLIDNIKLRGFSWTPLNSEGTKVINLDGNNKRISNLDNSLFADLNGTVKDLTIYNAVVSSSETVGILANTCNTAASTVSGVTITGDTPTGDPLRYSSTLTSTATSARKYVGGLVGEVSTLSTFDGCHIVNTIVSSPSGEYTYTGGGFGYVHHASSHDCYVKNCTVESSRVYSNSYTGGLIGWQVRGHIVNNKVGYDKDDNEKKCIVSGPNNEMSGNYKGGLSGVLQYGYENNNKVLCDINGSSYLGGLIGRMRQGQANNNENAGTITAISTYVGGFVGSMENGSISGNTPSTNVVGSVKESLFLGGFAGQITGGTVSGNSASGSVTSAGGQAASDGANGGFAGQITNGTVTNNSAIGNVNGVSAYQNGGFAGLISGGTVTGNSASGNISVTGGGYYNGGFVGRITNVTSFNNNYASGNTDGYKFYDGGLIGIIEAGENSIIIEKCFATGYAKVPKSRSNAAHVGGFIGRIESGTVTIRNCYSTGAVESYRFSGAFIGSINVAITVNNCYTNSAVDFAQPNNCALFIGDAGAKTISYSGLIAWNASGLTNFIRNTTITEAPSGNYFGISGTINSQATTLGWGSVVDAESKPVWDLTWGDNRPHLAWEPKP